MSDTSALLGAPPNNHNDELIRKGLLEIAPSSLNPIPGQPFGPPKPQGYVYESWSTSMQVGTAFAIFFVILFTAGRLAVRRFYARRLGFDDLVIVPAALGCLTYLSGIIIQTSAGCLGKHTWDCTYKEMGSYYEWAQIDFPMFYFTVFTIKLSIALQNRRMTLMASKGWQIIHWTFIIIFMILIPLITFIEIFRCTPVAINYSLQALASVPNPLENIKCPIDNDVLSYAARILHMITDIALLAVPIIIVVRLQMAWRKKARLVGIFAVGGLSTICSIVRNVKIGGATVDVTWDTHLVYAFNIIDIVTATVVASMPALNVFADLVFDKMKKYTGIPSSLKSLFGVSKLQGGRRMSSESQLVNERNEMRMGKIGSETPHVAVHITSGSLAGRTIDDLGEAEAQHGGSF